MDELIDDQQQVVLNETRQGKVQSDEGITANITGDSEI